LPNPLAPSEPLNPLLRGFGKARKAVDVDNYDLGNIKSGIQSIAGPDVTD